MASFKPSKKDYTEFNGGEKYRNNIDSPSATDFNNVIENLLALNEDSDFLHDNVAVRLDNAEKNIRSFDGKLDEISETIEQDFSETKKKVENLYARTFPEIDVIDSSVAYQRIVPIGALPYAEVAKVGGMSHKSANLITHPYQFPTSNRGVSFVVNSDLTIDVSGVPEASIYMDVATITLGAGTYSIHNYSVLSSDVRLYVTYGDKTLFANTTFTLTEDTSVRVRIAVYNTFDGSTVRITPMLNEGSTALPYSPYFEGLRHTKVTEIKSIGKNRAVSTDSSISSERGIEITRNIGKSSAVLNGTATADYATRLFGNFKLPVGTYTASVLGLNSTDRLYVGKTADGGVVANYIQTNSPKTFTLTEETECFLQIVWANGSVYNNTEIKVQIEHGNTATEYKPYTESSLPIPSAVQALPDYGLGVDAEYNNHIDWDEKKYHKEVITKVIDGTYGWWTGNTNGGGIRFQMRPSPAMKANSNVVCDKYNTVTTQDTWNNIDGICSNGDVLEIKDNRFTTVSELKAHLAENPITVVYALATPDEPTDISYLLPDDNFIRVEGGGTIVAVNEYGLAAPITINYQVD